MKRECWNKPITIELPMKVNTLGKRQKKPSAAAITSQSSASASRKREALGSRRAEMAISTLLSPPISGGASLGEVFVSMDCLLFHHLSVREDEIPLEVHP